MLTILRRALMLASAFALWATPAYADQIVVKRHVTLREEPTRTSRAIIYPEIGSVFVLLDDGRRVRGYYHVKSAQSDGWIYYTFVQRIPDAVVTTEPLVGPAATMAVHYIDVDQGAAALVEFPCGAVMIDAGGRGPAATAHLLDYLRRFFVRRPDLHNRIDAVFVTHTHVDHNSNLRAVAEAFQVRGYIDNGVAEGSGRVGAKWMREYVAAASPPIAADPVREEEVEAAGTRGLHNSVIDPVECPSVDPDIRVLSGSYGQNPGWPDGEFDNGNNQSLVIRIDFGKSSFLFTGDMEETAIETLVTRWSGTSMLDSDVWEVGHHGSHNGTTPALLAAISPKVAVILMGHESEQAQWTAWAYGHPRLDAVNAVVASVSQMRATATTVRVADRIKHFIDYPLAKAVYATGWDGDVTVRADIAGTITIEPGQ